MPYVAMEHRTALVIPINFRIACRTHIHIHTHKKKYTAHRKGKDIPLSFIILSLAKHTKEVLGYI